MTPTRRRRALLGLLVAAALVLGCAALWAAMERPWDVGPRLEAGEILPRGVSLDQELSDPIDIALPSGDLRVQFGDPIRETPAITPDGEPFPRPPFRGHFLPVQMEIALPEDGRAAMRLPSAQFPPPTAILTIGDHETDLSPEIEEFFLGDGRLALETRGFLIAMDSGEHTPELTVTVDGVAQTISPDGIEDEGRFAELHDAGTPTDTDCSGPRLPAGWSLRGTDEDESAEPTCSISGPMELPWVAGLGWAPPGEVWQVSSLEMNVPLSLDHATGNGPTSKVRVEDPDGSEPEVLVDEETPTAFFPTDEIATPLMIASVNPTWTIVSGPVPRGTLPALTISVSRDLNYLDERPVGSPDALTMSWSVAGD